MTDLVLTGRRHRIVMHDQPRPPVCLCGWEAPLPLACTWPAWERAAASHLDRIIACPRHGELPRVHQGRCKACRRAIQAAGDARRAAQQ